MSLNVSKYCASYFVCMCCSLQSYVREQVLQAIAVIFKRGTIDTPNSNRDGLFDDVTQLISSGNVSMVTYHSLDIIEFVLLLFVNDKANLVHK